MAPNPQQRSLGQVALLRMSWMISTSTKTQHKGLSELQLALKVFMCFSRQDPTSPRCLQQSSGTHATPLKAGHVQGCCLTAHVLDGWSVLQDAAPQLSRLKWLQVQVRQRSAAARQHRRAAAHVALSGATGACLQAERDVCEQNVSELPSLNTMLSGTVMHCAAFNPMFMQQSAQRQLCGPHPHRFRWDL